MMRYVIDTGVAADMIHRRGPAHAIARQRIADGGTIGLALPALGELFAGVELSQSRDMNLAILRRNLSSFKLWPFDPRAAEEYGKLFAHLRRIGRPIPHPDIQIAAVAIALGRCVVVTKDSDFSVIPGLSIENWSKPASTS